MSSVKAGKLLAKALDNSSKEEATTAFCMAFSYAERAGIRLSSIHRVEIVEVESGSIDPERERELIEKYNTVLKRAKELTAELEEARRQNTGSNDYQLRIDKTRAEERERATYAELAKTRSALEEAELKIASLRSSNNMLMAEHGRLKAENERLSADCAAASMRRDNLARDVQRLRDTALQMEKDKRGLQRQLAIEKMARADLTTTAEELAAALAGCMRLRATVSEQAEEIATLSSQNKLMHIELTKHETNPLKKLLGW